MVTSPFLWVGQATDWPSGRRCGPGIDGLSAVVLGLHMDGAGAV